MYQVPGKGRVKSLPGVSKGGMAPGWGVVNRRVGPVVHSGKPGTPQSPNYRGYAVRVKVTSRIANRLPGPARQRIKNSVQTVSELARNVREYPTKTASRARARLGDAKRRGAELRKSVQRKVEQTVTRAKKAVGLKPERVRSAPKDARRDKKTALQSPKYKGYDATEGKRSERKKDVLRCKERPKDAKPEEKPKGGGGGGKTPEKKRERKFIPWC